MKCAYCKEEVDRDTNTYRVEINGVECEIALHYDCLIKVIGEYFTRPKTAGPSSNNYVTVIPTDKQPWQPTWDCGGTLEVEKPSNTQVWCKSDYEDTHTPWRDRVD